MLFRNRWLALLRKGWLVILILWAPGKSAAAATADAGGVAPAVIAAVAADDPAPAPEVDGIEIDYVTFGLRRVAWFRDTLLIGEPMWKYFAFLIYVGLAVTAAKLIDLLTAGWLKRMADKSESKLDDLILELIRGPIKVVSLVVLLHIGLDVFHWPPWVEAILTKGLKIVVAFSLTYLAIKLADILLAQVKNRAKEDGDRALDDQLFPVLKIGARSFIIVVAVLVTSQNMGINITGVIASLSIGGLAIGLAAQDTLANLFGAIAVFLDRPFRIGDRIRIEAVDGTVEAIGLRSTRVRSADGFQVTIPNKIMGSATITNVSRRPSIRTEMNFGVTYDTSLEGVQRAVKILEEVCRAHPKTQDVWISFNRFADSALNITVIHWCASTDPRQYLADIQEINLQIKRRFEAEGIEFAFPSSTVYHRHLGSGVVAAPAPASNPVC